MMTVDVDKKSFTVALVGNPNCGKTSIFNGLVGARAHVGNYPGVTVEKRSATLKRLTLFLDAVHGCGGGAAGCLGRYRQSIGSK